MMQESSAMIEIRKIKEELSEKARGMSNQEFLNFIKNEAMCVKKSAKINMISN